MGRLLALFGLLGLANVAGAEVKTKVVEYDYEGTKLKGFLAYDDSIKGKVPGILVVHEFWGLDDYAKHRAQMLAKLGYVAFCPDMYGDGKVAEHPTDAGKMATTVRSNVKLWQGRATAGLKELMAQEHVDSKNLAVIGYCFGGSTALELAYTGADLKAVVTFHAALPTPTKEQAAAIKAKVLICNGGDDKMIPEKDITAFKSALSEAKIDLDFESFPGAVHSFTVKDADARKIPGIAYNQAADEKSWQQMQDLFKKVFTK